MNQRKAKQLALGLGPGPSTRVGWRDFVIGLAFLTGAAEDWLPGRGLQV